MFKLRLKILLGQTEIEKQKKLKMEKEKEKDFITKKEKREENGKGFREV